MLTITTPTQTRQEQITARIGAVLVAASGAELDKTAASEEFQAKVGAFSNLRLGALAELASYSHSEQWTAEEISTAVRIGSKSVNRESKAVATFASELKAAVDPKVRAHTGGIVTAVREAWAEEKALDKNDSHPLAKAFAREYHAVVRALGEAKQGLILTTVGKVIDWAVGNDPDMDPKKVAAKIADIATRLAELSGIYPEHELRAAVASLNSVTEDTLATSRAAVAANAEARMDGHKLAPVPDTTLRETGTLADGVSPAEGASNILDDMLASNMGIAA